MTMNFSISKDVIDFAEERFDFPDLLGTEYFRTYRSDYYDKIENCSQLGVRNYLNLLNFLQEVAEYNSQHAKSYVKRFSKQREWRDLEAVFCEVIIYRHYTKLAYEQFIRSIELVNSESDLIIERLDGSKAYLEAFCIMPNLKLPEHDGEIVVNDIRSHTQTSLASVRQKLIRKIEKQRQLSKPRDNYAVIELNNSSIAGDFVVQSSLSDGYKIDLGSNAEGYDWSNSIFEDTRTQFLRGVIYFSLGDYSSRRYIENPNFRHDLL